MNINIWVNILLPFFSIFIPVFATVYTVNNRIKNENRENHMPHLVLKEVNSLEKIDKTAYYLTLIGENYYKQHQDKTDDDIIITNYDNDIFVDLIIKNIGYGVATNIKFYNLFNGHQIHGTQANSMRKNQKLFTTYDIASGDSKYTQARIVNDVLEKTKNIIEDHNRILCVYQDLNRNVYDFIISINIKKSGHYDFFAFQPSSASYKKWIRGNKNKYRKIRKLYKAL